MFLATSELSPAVTVALAHVQLETIHPFTDGNGRTGRALVHMVLKVPGFRGLGSAARFLWRPRAEPCTRTMPTTRVLAASLVTRRYNLIMRSKRIGDAMAPDVRPSSDVRSHYDEVSRSRREGRGPTVLTVNGRGDASVMGIEDYEEQARLELLETLIASERDVSQGRAQPIGDTLRSLRSELLQATS